MSQDERKISPASKEFVHLMTYLTTSGASIDDLLHFAPNSYSGKVVKRLSPTPGRKFFNVAKTELGSYH